MLQIAAGVYFRAGVPINETNHRAVFYTNGSTLDQETIDLPIGRFTFATGVEPVTAVMVEVVDRLEAERPDGEPEFMIATGGTELIDDAATVFAFAANVTLARSLTQVERSIPRQLDARARNAPSNILRRTFDPRVLLHESDSEAVRTFSAQLLQLHRPHFEVAIRAIRKVVDATFLVGEDPTLAYTLLVAALESLAQHATSPEGMRSWDTYDPTKRKIIDAALAKVPPEQGHTIRDAVLEVDQLSIARRFQNFTLDHIRPSFYREEAQGALRPIRSYDLPHALKVAYRLRSRNIHELQGLAPELWAIPDRADTLQFEGRAVLSLEGLTRVARHVITAFVERSPDDLDSSFDYRDHLPGVVRVQFAPQYWIAQAASFTPATAPNYLNGFLEILLSPEPSKALPDLSPVLEKIEGLLSAENNPDRRRPMVALYGLWDLLLPPAHRRPDADAMRGRFASDLDDATIVSFAVHVLASSPIEWEITDLLSLVERRRDELRRGKGQQLPARLDTALLLVTAGRSWDEGDHAAAKDLVAEAVESLPGEDALLQLESLMDSDAVGRALTELDPLAFARAEWPAAPEGRPADDGTEGSRDDG